MKAIAEIAKTTSIVQKENALIDIKIQVDLTVTLVTASITGYNKNIQMESIRLRHNF